jgi:hypothetical protein
MGLAEMTRVTSFTLRLVVPAALFLAGCVGDLVDLTPREGPPMPDLSMGGGNPDMAATTLSFMANINPDITAPNGTCSSAACHGGATVPIIKDNDAAGNLTQFKLKVDAANPANSSVLLTGLPGKTPPHTGAAYFTGTNDAKYQKWLAWIQGGQLP